MISDYVKGKKKFDYPIGIQQGMYLHRAIDSFTDLHEATRAAKEVFRPAYRLYSGAFVDVVYDHFLALEDAEFAEQSLFDFAKNTYTILDAYTNWMPAPFARQYPYMKKQNWLYHYQTRTGIEKSLGGVVRRAAYLTESETAFQLFEEHFQLLQGCFRHLWVDIKPFAKNMLNELHQSGTITT